MTAVAGYYIIPVDEVALDCAIEKFFPHNNSDPPTTVVFYCREQDDVELLFKTLGPQSMSGCLIVKGDAAIPAATSVFGITFGEIANPLDSCVVIESKTQSDDDFDDDQDN